MEMLVSEFLQGVKAVRSEQSALHEPRFSGPEKEHVLECIDSGFVSSVGPFVNEFELRIAEYTGARHAVAVVNGTAGLHLSLHAHNIHSAHEVLIPSLTFVATANAVLYTGATPHFVDVHQDYFGVDGEKLWQHLKQHAKVVHGETINIHTGKTIKALLIVHVFGHPCDMDSIQSVLSEFPMILIEDAAEAMGSFSYGRHLGTFGQCGVLSFNGNKILTCGAGGAIVTDNSDLAAHLKSLSTTSKEPHPWLYVHREMAFNYRMPNINAALGVAQLKQLTAFLSRKRVLLAEYENKLNGIGIGAMAREPVGAASNYWLHNFVLNHQYVHLRDQILTSLNEAGYGARPVWEPLHTLDFLKNCPRMDLSVTLDLAARIISLPSGV